MRKPECFYRKGNFYRQENRKKNPRNSGDFSEFGRRERIRTSDPLVPNQLRYQAALLAEMLFQALFYGAKGGT